MDATAGCSQSALPTAAREARGGGEVVGQGGEPHAPWPSNKHPGRQWRKPTARTRPAVRERDKAALHERRKCALHQRPHVVVDRVHLDDHNLIAGDELVQDVERHDGHLVARACAAEGGQECEA